MIEPPKEKGGIERLNKSFKTLKDKYMTFSCLVADILGVEKAFFKISQSKLHKESLSKYVHSYAQHEEDFIWGSHYLNEARSLIPNVLSFCCESMSKDEGGGYALVSIEKNKLPPHARELLSQFTKDQIDENQLRESLRVSRNRSA